MLRRSPSFIARPLEFLSLSASRTRTLRTNFLWNASGSAAFALSQWGILIVFAKLGTASLVGQVVYGLALTAPLFVVAGLQLRSIQATDPEKRHTLGQYLGLRVLTTFAALILGILLAAIMWAIGSHSASLILLWTFSKAVDSGSDALYGFFQQSERMDYVGVSLLLRGVVGLASVAAVFRASGSAPLALAGMTVAWGAVFILFDIPMARRLLRQHESSEYTPGARPRTLRLTLDTRQLIPLCLEAMPLGMVALLLTIQMQVPRYVVVGVLHTRALGLFSAAAYLTFTGSILVNSLGAPACVRLAQFHVDGARSAFRHLMTKLLIMALALGVAGLLVSGFAGARILTLLYTKEYSSMAWVLTILCAASAVSYVSSFLGYGMTAMRRYKVQVPLFLFVVLLTLLSCYFLTRHYGLMGTAVGIFIGNLGQLIMSAGVVWKTARRNRDVPNSCAIIETAGTVS